MTSLKKDKPVKPPKPKTQQVVNTKSVFGELELGMDMNKSQIRTKKDDNAKYAKV